MPIIELHNDIAADRTLVFDLSRSIDLHKISTQHTHEEAIAGRTSGLIEEGEWVTWRAKHLGFYRELTSQIREMNAPNSFVDVQKKGPFHSFEHHHIFEETEGGTHMVDVFNYRSPLGILGRLADRLFLKKYMTKLLLRRNETIKQFAESGEGLEELIPTKK